MYRIRLTSGEEAAYRTAEELALAVSTGVVGSDSEVFHKAGNRWLPINVHPDYRAVVTGKRPAMPATSPATSAAPIVSEPVPDPGSLAARPPTVAEPPTAPPQEAGTARILVSHAEYDPAQDPTPVSPAVIVPGTGQSRTDRLRVMLALAMGIVAIGLLGGAAVASRNYLLPWLEQHRPAPTLTEGMPPESAPLVRPRLDSLSTRYPAPTAPLSPAGGGPRDSSASDTRTSRLRATRNRAPTYFEAYADARAEMDEGLEYINFQRVFAPSRFATPESLRATRRMVAEAGNVLRVYRGREVMVEQTYRPNDPDGHGSLRETFETAEATRSLLSDTDSLFGVLLAELGRFDFDGQSLRFKDPSAAKAYGELRRQILEVTSSWRDSSAAQDLVSMPRVLRAFASSTPPPLRR